ncbi:SAM-dependent methyltransferase [Orrella sp. 11846]|uniref:SAM-dependent methyltransferase n=1 Tax=Orrella sp. 11846 TaxID=3409913 RepID=UPI003B5CE638
MKGTLHLIPVGLSDTHADQWLPAGAIQTAAQLTHYIAENAKTARGFLNKMPLEHALQSIHIETLSNKTTDSAIREWLAPLKDGIDIGLVSEAGCPAVADPGSRVVTLAHQMNARVRPWVGPSSILLGLMASGLDGQRFVFHGYAPIQPDARIKTLRRWEQQSRQQTQTQILIETPYRNAAMIKALTEALSPQTRLCVASALTSETEWIKTQTIAQWKQTQWPDLSRAPTLFLFQA